MNRTRSRVPPIPALAMAVFTLMNASPILTEADPADPQQARDPSEILAAASESGRRVAAALRSYKYYEELTIETVSQADTISGKYYRFSQISYAPDGTRQERVLEDKSTLPKEVHIGTTSANNLTRIYQFMLTSDTLGQYEFNYVGRERIDELNCFAFDVRPTVKMPDPARSPERYLKGRVWIDDQDLQLVKAAGEALPEQTAHRTPRFETYFQNYADCWFPAYTSADDGVRVGDRFARVIVKVRFTGYTKAR
ncbi:MAG TPA: hypothetical protein VGV87_18535 [Blastocatellia bacterium]|nr:hypothetical protein [Blastocatellia bacterium]